ncbi:glycosyltransferase [Thalassospira povalilytica]|uniref:glycosyltransferase n=1 Tax=Thalassospira povalilytica TaxID=732237 RepID=UPI001D18D40D|nr:glycosyltransferase [Thalassospira povalilytica]MCC4240718.1 glycosyltransferase [Thalassospira povalilytica]
MTFSEDWRIPCPAYAFIWEMQRMQVSTVVVLSDSVRSDGGAAKVAQMSAVGLSNAGYRVIFISGETADVGSDLKTANVEVICLGLHTISDPANRVKTTFTGLWNIAAAKQLKNVLSNLDPANTVVHLHSWTKCLSSSVIPVIKHARFPLVLTLHDYFSACPNGGFFDYNTNQICDLRPLGVACLTRNCDARAASHKIWRVARQVIQLGLGKLPQAVDAFIAVSDLSYDVLRPYLPEGASVHRINNPIECSKIPPAKPAERDGVLFIGRLSKEKGPDLLAAAAREAQLEVTFVGDGELRESLEGAYPEHHFTGWLSFSDVLTLVDKARSLVFPSLWYETLGLVVLECAARGVPAIVSDNCAAKEIVVHEKTGILFAGGSTQDLKIALDRIKDNKMVERMGTSAYQHFWRNPPTLERYINNLVNCYHQLPDKHPALPNAQTNR